MNKTNTKKLAIAGVFCAVAVVGSLFSFPVLQRSSYEEK